MRLLWVKSSISWGMQLAGDGIECKTLSLPSTVKSSSGRCLPQFAICQSGTFVIASLFVQQSLTGLQFNIWCMSSRSLFLQWPICACDPLGFVFGGMNDNTIQAATSLWQSVRPGHHAPCHVHVIMLHVHAQLAKAQLAQTDPLVSGSSV